MSDLRLEDDVTVTLMGKTATDFDVIDAARVSTLGEGAIHAATSTKQMTGLINFLMRDRHGSPFEHNSMTFFVKAPIFVAREFMRHRVGWSYNEESARYRELRPVFYTPGPDRDLIQVGKPGAYTFEPGTDTQRQKVDECLRVAYEMAWRQYRYMLDQGIAREVARVVLPVGVFTSFYATCNARSLMHFLGLRTRHEDAKVPSFPQREIEMVAEKMEATWAAAMPITYAAFNANGRISP